MPPMAAQAYSSTLCIAISCLEGKGGSMLLSTLVCTLLWPAAAAGAQGFMQHDMQQRIRV
jgi:hypothetical protein